MNEIWERVLANSFSGIHKSKIICSVEWKEVDDHLPPQQSGPEIPSPLNAREKEWISSLVNCGPVDVYMSSLVCDTVHALPAVTCTQWVPLLVSRSVPAHLSLFLSVCQYWPLMLYPLLWPRLHGSGETMRKLLLSATNKLVVSFSIQPSAHRWASTGSCNLLVDYTDSMGWSLQQYNYSIYLINHLPRDKPEPAWFFVESGLYAFSPLENGKIMFCPAMALLSKLCCIAMSR